MTDPIRTHADAALSHLSNALDDLQYSPDQRPVPLIREAMHHLRELITSAQQPQAAHLADVLAEVERATRKFPTWPTDPLHALAVLGEEFGELTKAALQTAYKPHKVESSELRTEAIQTAAMALRFLASLDAYRFAQSEQHLQKNSHEQDR